MSADAQGHWFALHQAHDFQEQFALVRVLPTLLELGDKPARTLYSKRFLVRQPGGFDFLPQFVWTVEEGASGQA